MTTTTPRDYKCLIGFDYCDPKSGESTRFEPGEIVDGLPVGVLRALAEAPEPAVEAASNATPAAKSAKRVKKHPKASA